MTTYSEKLKDPRWQKKRLEILNRDNFSCKSCYDTKSTLHVHHIRYQGCDPWEIDSKYLVTLCEECHSDIKEIDQKLRDIVDSIASEYDYEMKWNIASVIESLLTFYHFSEVFYLSAILEDVEIGRDIIKRYYKNNKKSIKKKEEVATEKKSELIIPWPNIAFMKAWNAWKEYKKQEHRFSFKSEKTEQISLNSLFKDSEGSEAKAIEMIYNSISKNWKGIYRNKDEQKNIKASKADQNINNAITSVNNLETKYDHEQHS